ncbi:MAG: hypothetical protein HN509_12045 [Halobacteriovoraceae bacterium]|nr:hypothetical protein [Halobacteriovoraceae bacterium]MBT5095793.1 hypothetical protein [Halobacteriovoraceae bacterium]
MKFFILAIYLLCQSASAAPYYRFWRGFKKKDISTQKFHQGLNSIFIPRTIDQGKKKGLLAYLPVLSPKTKSASIPEEVALVVYSNRDDYQTLRKSPAGQVYGKLHWDYFAKGISKSLVPSPLPLVGELVRNHAYDVLSSPKDWQKGYVIYSLKTRRLDTSNTSFQRAFKNYIKFMSSSYGRGKLESLIVLVGETYTIEYQLWKNRPDYFNVRKDPKHIQALKKLSLYLGPYQEHPLPQKIRSISFGQGLNTRF